MKATCTECNGTDRYNGVDHTGCGGRGWIYAKPWKPEGIIECDVCFTPNFVESLVLEIGPHKARYEVCANCQDMVVKTLIFLDVVVGLDIERKWVHREVKEQQ